MTKVYMIVHVIHILCSIGWVGPFNSKWVAQSKIHMYMYMYPKNVHVYMYTYT